MYKFDYSGLGIGICISIGMRLLRLLIESDTSDLC